MFPLIPFDPYTNADLLPGDEITLRMPSGSIVNAEVLQVYPSTATIKARYEVDGRTYTVGGGRVGVDIHRVVSIVSRKYKWRDEEGDLYSTRSVIDILARNAGASYTVEQFERTFPAIGDEYYNGTLHFTRVG